MNNKYILVVGCYSARMTISEDIASELGKVGLCVLPDFLSSRELCETRRDFDQIESRGGFVAASTGKDSNKEIRPEIRGDKIYWLDPKTANETQLILWKKIELLKEALNRTLYLGTVLFEGHYSSYSSGAFYKRHLDCFHSNSQRMVSFILYLNQDWVLADGGQLRIYGSNETYTDVEPIGGTLVCFLSRESEHEVLLSHSKRCSFSGWFKI